jgi:N-acetylmuramoyl-L-alanine amidase
MILRALCIDYSEENGALNNFSDTDAQEWQAKVVNKAAKLGWISTTNSTFRPNDSISRAEALKMVMQAAGVPMTNSTTSSFADVSPTSWMAKYTETAKYYGIVSGQIVDGVLKFRPTDSVKRGESTKMIIKSLFPTPSV